MSKVATQLRSLDLEKVITLKGEEGIAKLNYLLRNAPMRSVVCKIYPCVAKVIMNKYHGINRSLNERYMNRVKNSEDWFISGDTIKFNKKKKLCDGQHRLQAVINSKKPMVTHVVFGIVTEAFKVIDTGKGRGASDVLSIEGARNNPNVIASIIRCLSHYNNNGMKTNPTNDYFVEQYRKDGPALEASMKYYREVRKAYPGYPPSVFCSVYYIISKTNDRAADEFAVNWLHGPFSGENMVFRVYAQKILNWRNQFNRNLTYKEYFALFIDLFNDWVVGRVPKSDSVSLWTTKKPFPKIKAFEYEG